MQRVTGFIKAVYNFFVGDPIILSGIVALFIVVGVIVHLAGTSSVVLGIVLVAGVITSLALALYRETQPKRS